MRQVTNEATDNPISGALLSGVRVLDLSEGVPGPFAAKLLAYLGAEVIKIEHPGHGDASRRASPFLDDLPNPETSGSFLYLNGGKKSVTLDVATSTGAHVLKQLVQESQVLIESYHPAYLEDVGLSYEALERVNPAIVLTSVSHFGGTGPYSGYRGGELVDFAAGGNLNLMGLPERSPIKFGGNAGQYLGAVSTLSGTMLALYSADGTGAGQHVDVSIQESLVCCHIQDLCNYAYTGEVQGRGHGSMIYPCKDGYVGLTLQQHLWPRVCAMLDMPELEHDPMFATFQGRRENADLLDVHIIGWMIERTKEEVYHQAQSYNMPTGYVATVEDIVKSPQHDARGFIVEMDHPAAGRLKYPGAPFRIAGVEVEHRRAPMLGEHNVEVLTGLLGYDNSDLVMLRGAGVI